MQDSLRVDVREKGIIDQRTYRRITREWGSMLRYVLSCFEAITLKSEVVSK